jgi:hypothetical protein
MPRIHNTDFNYPPSSPTPSSRIHWGSDPPDRPGAQGAESALQRGTPARQDQGWRPKQLLQAYLRGYTELTRRPPETVQHFRL